MTKLEGQKFWRIYRQLKPEDKKRFMDDAMKEMAARVRAKTNYGRKRQ